MTGLMQIALVVLAVLAMSMHFAKADESARQAEKVPLSLKPHPDHDKYLGWDGAAQWMQDEQEDRLVRRTTKQRFAAAAELSLIHI